MTSDKIISNTLLLYELSMSIGKSLDFNKNCDSFLKLFMARKNLDACWIVIAENKSCKFSYALPEISLNENREIPLGVFAASLENKFPVSSSVKEINKQYLPYSLPEGKIAVFKLLDNALLFIHSTNQTALDRLELHKLEPIIDRFGRSILACMHYSESEKRKNSLNLLFENHPIPIMVYGIANEQFLAVNQTAITNYGYSRDEFLKMQIANLHPPEEIDSLKTHLEKVRQGECDTKEWTHITKDGKRMDVEINANFIEFEEQKARLVLIKDITEQKQIANKLTASEQKYRMLVETASDIIYGSNLKGEFTYVNPTAVKMTGYSKEELIGMRFAKMVRRDYKRAVHLFYQKQFTEEIPSTYYEFPIITKTGKEIWIGQTCDFQDKETRNEKGVVALARNITDRKMAEEALVRSEEKYRNIIENLELGLVEVDNNDTIQKAYPKFCELSGYSSEELVGRKVMEMLLPEEFHSLMKQQNVERLNNKSGVYELQLIHKNGNRIWVIISGAPFHDKEGSVIGSVGIHLDITERKQMEHELRRAKETAENSVKSKELFMANMSHEIRTPMNAIVGMGELLQKTTLEPKQLKYVDAIQTSADNLLIIINDILDFSKIEAGKMELEYIPVYIPKLVHDVTKIIELKSEEKGLELKIEIDKKIEGYLTDPTRLSQVLINLLSNAVKFSDEGSIQLNCIIQQESAKTDVLCFSVKDTGIGIDINKLDNIFESFIQADETTARKYGGTGLGLPISKQLVGMMGGELNVKSEINKGAEFYFSIELERVEIEQNPESKKEENTSILKGKKILLVEDHLINQFVAQTILENWECVVDLAVNGLEAVAKTEKNNYDIILMDMRMPELDGIGATEIIRNKLQVKTPIIALTANAIIGDSEKCLAVGMNDFVSKPFKQEDLREKMMKYISKTPSTLNLEPIIEEKLVDLTVLEQSTGGDKEFMKKMIQLFIDDTPKQLVQLNNAIAECDWETVSRIAHRLKPSIDHIASKGMQSLVREVEAADDSTNTICSIATSFSNKITDLIEQLKAEI